MAATELALISGFKGRLCAFSYFYDHAVLIWLLIFMANKFDPEGQTTTIHKVGKHQMNRPFQKELIDCHKKQVSIILRNIIAKGNKI